MQTMAQACLLCTLTLAALGQPAVNQTGLPLQRTETKRSAFITLRFYFLNSFIDASDWRDTPAVRQCCFWPETWLQLDSDELICVCTTGGLGLTGVPRVPRAPFSPGSPGCPMSPRVPTSPGRPGGPLSPWKQIKRTLMGWKQQHGPREPAWTASSSSSSSRQLAASILLSCPPPAKQSHVGLRVTTFTNESGVTWSSWGRMTQSFSGTHQTRFSGITLRHSGPCPAVSLLGNVLHWRRAIVWSSYLLTVTSSVSWKPQFSFWAL